MPEPTPSQLKIDGTLTISDGLSFDDFTIDTQEILKRYKFTGAISPLNPDAESFMVSIPKSDLQQVRDQIAKDGELIDTLLAEAKANDKAYSDLAGQLAQERKRSKDLYTILSDENASKYNEILKLMEKIEALELRLRVKDSPIKAGLKRIWKWFKGLVGK